MPHRPDLLSTCLTERDLQHLSSRVGLADLSRYPDWSWHRGGLSVNPVLTSQLYLDTETLFPNIQGAWYYREILYNLGVREVIPFPVSIQFKRQLPDGYQLPDGHRTIKWIETHYENHLTGSWYWAHLIGHCMTGQQVVDLNNDPEWCHCVSNITGCCCYRPNVTLDMILRLGSKGPYHQWHWENLTRSVHPDEILSRLDLPWETDAMLRNSRLTLALCREWHRRKYGTVEIRFTRRFLNRIAAFIQYEEMITIPDYEQRPWSLGWLSMNRSMDVRWLREVVRLWPRAYGKFDEGALDKRSNAIAHCIHGSWFVWPGKKPYFDLLNTATIRDAYFLGWYHRVPGWTGRALTLDFSQVVRTYGVEVADLQRLFPQKWSYQPRVDRDLYQDIDLITVH